MKSYVMKNRFSLSPDGWIHLVPRGEHPWTSEDKTVSLIQVVDDPALDAMVKNFRPELLVDFDHESHDPGKRTTAGAWISSVEVRPDGLWGKPRWSEEGEKAVTGGEMRFISPVFSPADCEDLGNGRIRPLKLHDAGLTNKPNMKSICPITNRLLENAGTSEGAKKGWETRRGGAATEKKSDEKKGKAKGRAAKSRKAPEKKTAKDSTKKTGTARAASRKKDIEKAKKMIADQKAAKAKAAAARPPREKRQSMTGPDGSKVLLDKRGQPDLRATARMHRAERSRDRAAARRSRVSAPEPSSVEEMYSSSPFGHREK